MTFRPTYFFLTVLLFLIEVGIALYVTDDFVRPYVGDFLVVILLYCAVRAFFKISVVKAVTGVLLFAYLIECLQYFRLVDKLELQHHTLARTVIGYGFEWKDMLAYTLGAAAILLMEWRRRKGTGEQ